MISYQKYLQFCIDENITAASELVFLQIQVYITKEILNKINNI